MGTIRQRITEFFAYLRRGFTGLLHLVRNIWAALLASLRTGLNWLLHALQKLWGWFRRSFNSVRLIGLVLLAFALVAGVSGYREVHGSFDLLTFLGDFYANISAELGSIAVTVLIIDTLNTRRATQDKQDELLAQVRSRSTDTALSAIEMLRHHGWLIGDAGLLNDVMVFKAKWDEANLEGANLQGTNLGFANLQEADLEEANLQEADLGFANLQEADLGFANLQEANLEEANLQGTNLGRANLQGTNLVEANLKKANLGFANLQEADLGFANLEKADLKEANLQQANLEGANLEKADLGYANLQEANLRGANLQGANLDGAQFDEQTILPDAELVRADNGWPMLDENDNWLYTPASYWTPDTDMSRYTDPEHPDFWQPMWAKLGYASYQKWWVAGEPTE